MSEPLVERIAQWLLAALQEVATARGYHYTLNVSRPLDLNAPDDSIGDLTTILELGPSESIAKGTQTHRHKKRHFVVSVYLIGSEAGVPIDQRLARIEADIARRMGIETAAHRGSDRMCGGLAYDIETQDGEVWIDRDRNATVLIVPIAISYKQLINDPYAQ